MPEMSGAKLSLNVPHKPTVLVVDDELGPRESISYALSGDFSVEAAESAAVALELIGKKEYAVIVLDIRMPGMDGLSALGHLRKIDPDVSVIMLTGYGTLQSAQESMLAGANQYLRKPPDVGELIESVRRQAQATRLRRQQTRIGDEMRMLNLALKKELEAAEPQVWQARTSAELVHDLTSPLLVVMGYSTLVLEEALELAALDPEKSKRLVDHAHMVARAAEYARHLTDNWRQVTKESVQFEPVDLSMLAHEVHSLLFFDRADLKVLAEPGMFVRGARFELLRVLQNLIKNGFEAGSTEVVVRVQRQERNIVLSVEDNGGGMDAQAVEKTLKGRYSTKSDGSGLGLQICRHLVGVHGGRLRIESKLGSGTILMVHLPLASPPSSDRGGARGPESSGRR